MKILSKFLRTILRCKDKFYFSLGYIPFNFKYFSSEWSFSKYKINYNTKSVCIFGENNNLLILTFDGNLHEIKLEDKTDLTALSVKTF